MSELNVRKIRIALRDVLRDKYPEDNDPTTDSLLRECFDAVVKPLAATPAPQAAPSEPVAKDRTTEISRRLRSAAIDSTWPLLSRAHILAAADEIERYYRGMLNWKASAEAKDAAQQSPADARDATRWRETVRNVGFIRGDGGPHWVIGVPCSTWGNSDEQFTAAIDAQVAAIAAATTSTEGR